MNMFNNNDISLDKQYNNKSEYLEPFFVNTDTKPKKHFQMYDDQFKPDWIPDFSEKIDIVSDSINLALNTLNMSRAEYNSLTNQELKARRGINSMESSLWALNILIYYKKKSNSLLPELEINKNNSKILSHEDFVVYKN